MNPRATKIAVSLLVVAIAAVLILVVVRRGGDDPNETTEREASALPTKRSVAPGLGSSSTQSTVRTTTSADVATTGTTSLSPSTTRLVAGPCRVSSDASGLLEAFQPMVGKSDEFNPGALVQRGAQPRPTDWRPQPQTGFDWDGDGQGDELRYDAALGIVTVDWHRGRLELSDVRQNTAARDGIGSLAIVEDVTGDGRLDLIVANGSTVGVVTGDAGASGSTRTRFQELAAAGTGWLNPPKTLQVGVFADNSPNVRELPLGGATLRPVWDITGDGIADFALDNSDARSTGATYYYAGKACA